MNNFFLASTLLLTILFSFCFFVSPYSELKYSNPTYSNGEEIQWNNQKESIPSKQLISKEEWNKIFEDYRSGLISKEEAKAKIKEVEVEW